MAKTKTAKKISTGSLIESNLLSNIGLEGLPLSPEDAKKAATNDRSKYLAAIARKAANLTDEKWEGLLDDAKIWVTNCVSEIRNGATTGFTDFPDYDKTEKAEEVKEKEAVKKEEVEESEPVEEKSAKTAGKRGPRSSKPGTSEFFRSLILNNMEKGKEDVMDMSAKGGYPIPKGSASTIFYETHATVKLMLKLKLL